LIELVQGIAGLPEAERRTLDGLQGNADVFQGSPMGENSGNLEGANDPFTGNGRRFQCGNVLALIQNLASCGAQKLGQQVKQVVLPAPLGPIRACISPWRICRLTSSTATNPLNSLTRLRVSRTNCSLMSHFTFCYCCSSQLAYRLD